MTLIGVGADIEDISRFRNRVFDENKEFYEKIFTPEEIEYCLKKNDPYQHFAVRFCAKEAFIKAMPKKIVDHKKVEIKNIKDMPTIAWKDFAVHLSMSHEKDKAIAFVIINQGGG